MDDVPAVSRNVSARPHLAKVIVLIGLYCSFPPIGPRGQQVPVVYGLADLTMKWLIDGDDFGHDPGRAWRVFADFGL